MDETQGRIVNLLEEEASLLKKLNELLLEETEALKAKDINLVDELTASKTSLLDQLGVMDKQRQLYLDTGNNAPVYDQTFEVKVSEMKTTIQGLLDECKHQNKINGSIIEISQMFNSKIMDIVLGHNSQDETYSAEGKNYTKNYQNSIARV